MKSAAPSSSTSLAWELGRHVCLFWVGLQPPPSIGWRWTADRISVSKSCFSLIPSADVDVCSHSTVSFLALREGVCTAHCEMVAQMLTEPS